MSYTSSFRRRIAGWLRLILALGLAALSGIGAARAQGPASAEIDTLRLVASELAGGFGVDSPVELAGQSLDLIFLLEELEKLQANNDLVDDACGGADDISLRLLADPACLAALIDAERKVWRLGAELAAELHLESSADVAAGLDLPDGTIQADDESREDVEKWWEEARLTGLEAVARIGREWMKHKGGDAAQRALGLQELEPALRQIGQEPAVVHLLRALDGDESGLYAPLEMVLDDRATVEERAEAAVAFAVLYAELQAQAMRERFDAEVDGAGCRAHLSDEFILAFSEIDALGEAEDLAETETLCLEALKRMQVAALDMVSTVEAEGSRFAQVAGVLDEAHNDPEAFVAALTESFLGRQTTLRLLLGKAVELEDVGDCGEAVAVMAGQTERFEGPLDLAEGTLQSAVENIAGVVGSCLEAAAADQIVGLCEAVTPIIDDGLAGGEEAVRNLPDNLPEVVSGALGEPWRDFVDAVGVGELLKLCADLPTLSPGVLEERLAGYGDEVRQAFDALLAASTVALEQAAFGFAFAALERIEVPAVVTEEIETALTGLCRLTGAGVTAEAGSEDQPRSVGAMIADAIRDDIGLENATALVTVCERVRLGDDILALADVEEVAAGAEEITQAAKEVAEALDQLGDNAGAIAEKVATAAVILEAAAAIDGVLPLGDAEVCGPVAPGNLDATPLGLDLGFSSDGMASALTAEDGVWTITLSSTLRIAVCGVQASERDEAQQIATLASATVDFSEPVEVTSDTTAEDVSERLRAAMQTAVRNADIDIQPDEDTLRRVAQAAGLNLDALQALRFGPLEEVSFAPQVGLKFDFDFPPPINAKQSFCVPIGEASLECPTFDQAGDVLLDLLKVVAEKELRALIEGLVEDADDALAETLLQEAELSLVGNRLFLTLPSSVLERSLPGLTGDFTIAFALDDEEVQLVTVPTLDVVTLINTAFEGLAGVLRIEVVAEPKDWEEDTLPADLTEALRFADDDACRGGYTARLELAPGAPLVGTIGFVCLTERGENPTFVPGTDVDLTTPDGAWTLALNGQVDARDGARDIEIRVTSTAPLFGDVSDILALLRVDLAERSFVLPSDAEANADLYRLIETALSDRMPAGVRVYGLELSSDGIQISVDPSGAVDRAFVRLADAVGAELEEWAAWAGNVQDVACSSAGEVYRLGRILNSGILPDIPSGCVNLETARGTIAIRAAEIKWSCRGATYVDGAVTECKIDLPQEIQVCGGDLSVFVEWTGQGENRARKVTSDALEDCVRDRLISLLPIDTITLENFALDFDGGCIGSQNPADCAVTVTVDVTVPDLTGDVGARLPDACDALVSGSLSVTARLTLDGTLNTATSGATDLRQDLRICGEALVAEAAVAAMVELDDALGDFNLHDAMAEAGKASLRGLAATFATIADRGHAECRLIGTGDIRSCDSLVADDLRTGNITGASVVAPLTLLGQTLQLRADLTWGQLDIGLGNFQEIRESGDPEAWIRGKWDDLADSSDLAVSLECVDGRDNCLNTAAGTIARTLADSNDFIAYTDGATLTKVGQVFTLTLPLELTIPEIGLEAPFTPTCTLDFSNLDQLEPPDCSAGFSDFVLQALFLAMDGILPSKHAFDFGIATVTVSDEGPELVAEQGHIRIPVTVSLSGLGFDEKVESAVLIDRDLKLDFEEIDYSTLVGSLTGTLSDFVNDLTGELGVKVTAIDPVFQDDKLTGLNISSEVAIPNLFSITAPLVVLDEDGLRIEGPNRFGIRFEDGLQILVPPFAICPTGGEIVDKQITLTATVTLIECTSRYLVSYRGSLTFEIDKPQRMKTEGSLTLLSVIPLGSNSGEMDLVELYFQQAAELGGALSDIIFLSGQFRIDGAREQRVTADGQLRVFRAPVGRGDFLLDLNDQRLDTSVDWDMVIAHGQGAVRTQARFSRPEAVASTEMRVGGFSAFRADFLARPNLLRLRLNVLGIRLAVVFPGLDRLDEGAIKDLIRKLLTPDFENLDEALAALLSGNITMNPFGDFGEGGEGMGDSGDSEAGESGSNDSAGDPGEGLADGAAPEPVPGETGQTPEDGSEGLIGLTAANVTYDVLEGEALVRISVGVPGAHDARHVTLARLGDGHFAADGQPLGRLLSVLPVGYSQLRAATSVSCGDEPEAGEEATGQTLAPGDVVYFYTGETAARRGYYELCRMTVGDGQPLNITDLDDEAKSDLSDFHETLITEMQARGPVEGGDHGRLLLRGRMVVEDGLRGVIGFQRPGELLVVMTGSLGDSACGEAPLDAGPPQTRQFWLTGTTIEDLREPTRVLGAVRALWNCPTGTLGRIDVDRLTTATSVSTLGDNGLVTPVAVLEIDGVTPQPLCCTPPVEPVPPLPEPNILPICNENCVFGAIIIRQREDGLCEVLVSDVPTGLFPPGSLGDGGCSSNKDAVRATFSSADSMKAYVLSDQGGVLLVATPVGWAQTAAMESLVLLPDLNRPSAEQWLMINQFLDLAIRRMILTEMRQNEVRHVSNAPTREALLAPISDTEIHWTVRDNEQVRSFTQTGPSLNDAQARAALPFLTGDVTSAHHHEEPGRLFVDREGELWVYQWDSGANDGAGAWEHVARVTRANQTWEPGALEASPTRAEVAVDLFDILAGAETEISTAYDIRIIPPEHGRDFWAYAWDNGTDGGLMVREIVRSIGNRMDLAGRLAADQTQLGIPVTDKKIQWVDLVVPPGRNFTVSLEPLDNVSDDPVLCLFSLDGTLLASNDDYSGYYSQFGFQTGRQEESFLLSISNFNRELDFRPAVKIILQLDVATDSASSSRLCPPFEFSESLLFFDGLTEQISITGLSSIMTDDARLSALAVAVRGWEHGALTLFGPGLAERREPLDPLHVAYTDGAGQLVFRTLGIDGLRPLGVFKADHPPEDHWPRLAEHLASWQIAQPGDNPVITGANLSNYLPEDAGITDVWEAVLPGADLDSRSVHYLADDTSRVIELESGNGGPEIIARAARYMIGAGADRLVVLRSEPLIVRTETDDCAGPEGDCAERLVVLPAGSEPEGIDLSLRNAEDVADTVVDLFARIVERDAALFDGLPQRLASTGGPQIVQLTEDRPLHVILPDSRWACLKSGIPLASLATRVTGWPDDAARGVDIQGLCGDADIPVWALALSDTQEILYLDEDGPLVLRRLTDAGADLDGPDSHPMSAVLKRLLVDRLVEVMQADDTLSLLDATTDGQDWMPIIEVAGNGRRVWIAGIDGPPACRLGDISADVPDTVDGGLAEALTAAVRDILHSVRERATGVALCPAAVATTINVVERNGIWDIWHLQTDAAADLPVQVPGIERRSAKIGAEEVTYAIWALSESRILHLDARVADRGVRDTTMRSVADLMDLAGLNAWEVTLRCDTDCATLIGETATGHTVAVAGGRAVGFDVTSEGFQPGQADDFALAVAAYLTGGSAQSSPAWFEARLTAAFPVAAGLSDGAVLAWQQPSGSVVSLGTLPDGLWQRDPSDVAVALRGQLLDQIGDAGKQFTITHLEVDEGGIERALLAFDPADGSPYGQRIVRSNGIDGPTFWTEDPTPGGDDLELIGGRIGADSRLASDFWLPGAGGLFSLEGRPTDISMILRARLTDSGQVDLAFGTGIGCELPIANRFGVGAGLARMDEISAATCGEHAGRTVLRPEGDRVLVAQGTRHAFLTLQADVACVGLDADAVLAELAGPALRVRGGAATLHPEGRVILAAAGGTGRLLWRVDCEDAAKLGRIGRFSGFDLETPDHRRLAVDLAVGAALRGEFLTIGADAAVRFRSDEKAFVNVAAGSIVHFEFVDPREGDADIEAALAAYLGRTGAASGFVDPVAGRLMVFGQGGDHLTALWVGPDHENVLEGETWPDGIGASAVVWYAAFLEPAVRAGHQLRAVYSHQDTTLSCSDDAGQRLLAVAMTEGETLRGAADQKPFRLDANCRVLADHLQTAIAAATAFDPKEQVLELYPGDGTRPALVLSAVADGAAASALHRIGTSDLPELLCSVEIRWSAPVTQPLGAWLAAGRSPCDWALIDGPGSLALVRSGEAAALIGENGVVRPIEPVGQVQNNRVQILAWFADQGLGECDDPIIRLQAVGDVLLMDDHCDHLARSEDAAGFEPFLIREQGSALSDRVFGQLAVLDKGDPTTPLRLRQMTQLGSGAVSITAESDQERALLLDGMHCAWLTTAGGVTVEKVLAEMPDRAAPSDAEPHHYVRNVTLDGLDMVVTVAGLRAADVCTEMSEDVLPPVSVPNTGWTFEGNKEGSGWYGPLAVGLAEIEEAEASRPIAVFVAAQLRDGVEAAHLWRDDGTLFVIKTQEGVCLRLVNRDSKDGQVAVMIAPERFQDVGRLLGSNLEYSVRSLVEAMNKRRDGVVRWYEPLISDPRSRLMAEPRDDCLP